MHAASIFHPSCRCVQRRFAPRRAVQASPLPRKRAIARASETVDRGRFGDSSRGSTSDSTSSTSRTSGTGSWREQATANGQANLDRTFLSQLIVAAAAGKNDDEPSFLRFSSESGVVKAGGRQSSVSTLSKMYL